MSTEPLPERIAEALYVRVMDATADAWTEWQYLTEFKREPYLSEAAKILATTDQATHTEQEHDCYTGSDCRGVSCCQRTEQPDDAALRELAEGQRDGYAEMLRLDGGVGKLGIERPEMFDAMLSWQDASENDHADTVLMLLDRLAAAQPDAASTEQPETSVVRDP